jgi:hypothetical protein
VWENKTILLKRHEIDRILSALAGRSLKTSDRYRDDPELLRLIETEPVLAVAIEYVEQCDNLPQEKSMAQLWKDWHDFAGERGLLQLGRNKFPGGANVLSRKLSQLKTVLNQTGISVTKKRSDGSKVIIERRKDDGIDEPSSGSSSINPNDTGDLHRTDDRKQLLASLSARKSKTAT